MDISQCIPDTSWLKRVSDNFNNGVIKMLNIKETDPDVLVADPVTLDKQNREANESINHLRNCGRLTF